MLLLLSRHSSCSVGSPAKASRSTRYRSMTRWIGLPRTTDVRRSLDKKWSVGQETATLGLIMHCIYANTLLALLVAAACRSERDCSRGSWLLWSTRVVQTLRAYIGNHFQQPFNNQSGTFGTCWYRRYHGTWIRHSRGGTMKRHSTRTYAASLHN